MIPPASPLPWKWMRENENCEMVPCGPEWQANQYYGNKYICDANGEKIMGVGEYDIMQGDHKEADAAFVISAVNAYPLAVELVAALEAVQRDDQVNEHILRMSTMKIVEALLTRAKGEFK